MGDCKPGLFGRPHPHAFEPRYSEAPAAIPGMDHFWTVVSMPPQDIVKLHKRKYLGDICTRCGEWRALPAPPDAPGEEARARRDR